MNGWMGLLKVDGTNRSAALDFRLQSSYQPAASKKKGPDHHDGLWEVAADAWLGVPSSPSPVPTTKMLTPIITKAAGTNTPARILKPRGQAPGRRQVVIVGRVLMRLVWAVQRLALALGLSMMTGTIKSRLVKAEQLGAIGLTEAACHLPELQQRLRDPAQIFNVVQASMRRLGPRRETDG